MAFAKDVTWDSELVKENSQFAKEKAARESHQDSRKAASKYDFVKVRTPPDSCNAHLPAACTAS